MIDYSEEQKNIVMKFCFNLGQAWSIIQNMKDKDPKNLDIANLELVIRPIIEKIYSNDPD